MVFNYFLYVCSSANTYCLRVWYSFIFDSFGASQEVYRNLWYIESSLWKEFFYFCYFCPGSQKINILTAQYKWISNAQAVFHKYSKNNDTLTFRLYFQCQCLTLVRFSVSVLTVHSLFWKMIFFLKIFS